MWLVVQSAEILDGIHEPLAVRRIKVALRRKLKYRLEIEFDDGK